MHNIDRTNVDWPYQRENGEVSAGMDADEGAAFEAPPDEEFGFPGFNLGSLFSESEEDNFAAELLTITDEGELDQFLGDLFKKASQAVGGFLKSPIGKALGGALKGVIRKSLPMVGRAAGNLLVPGAGGAVGGALLPAAGRMFGLEIESLSPEDAEFQVAKGLVRLAGGAASNAAQAPPSTPMQKIVQSALTAAAQQYAPGLLRGATPKTGSRQGRPRPQQTSGRWMRRGNSIILLGV
jgi:hypothetical protein